MIGDINDPSIGRTIGRIFGGAAAEVRERINRSVESEEYGERGVGEGSITDDLIDRLKGSIKEKLNGVAHSLSNTGTEVKIEFYPTNLPVTEETKFGADIGIRMSIRTKTFTTRKGILIQCKRMYNKTYPQLRVDGEDQARKMLNVTPASFFMLYNFGLQEELLNLITVPAGTLCPIEFDGNIPYPMWTMIGSQCVFWKNSAGGIWDLGIAVLPATRVLAISDAAKRNTTPFPTDARIILQGCLPVGVFVVDLLASCFVGDIRPKVVSIVTPPKLRKRPIPRRPEPFPVRHYMDISIVSKDATGL